MEEDHHVEPGQEVSINKFTPQDGTVGEGGADSPDANRRSFELGEASSSGDIPSQDTSSPAAETVSIWQDDGLPQREHGDTDAGRIGDHASPGIAPADDPEGAIAPSAAAGVSDGAPIPDAPLPTSPRSAPQASVPEAENAEDGSPDFTKREVGPETGKLTGRSASNAGPKATDFVPDKKPKNERREVEALRWIEKTHKEIANATKGLWAHDEEIRLRRIKDDLEKQIRAAPKRLIDQHYAVVAAHDLKVLLIQIAGSIQEHTRRAERGPSEKGTERWASLEAGSKAVIVEELSRLIEQRAPAPVDDPWDAIQLPAGSPAKIDVLLVQIAHNLLSRLR
ncbi:MAG: hypothetical protein ACJ8AW_10325 [Rhodopila sp.]